MSSYHYTIATCPCFLTQRANHHVVQLTSTNTSAPAGMVFRELRIGDGNTWARVQKSYVFKGSLTIAGVGMIGLHAGGIGSRAHCAYRFDV